MNQVKIAHTDIVVSRLGFGTAALHHLFNASDRQTLLRTAADMGITHYDTSPYYGYGLAETDLGQFSSRDRSKYTFTTKIGLYPWGFANKQAMGVWARKAIGKLVPRLSLPVIKWQVAHARASLDASLRRLRTDYVDFLLLHEPEVSLIETDEMLAWLEREFDAGRVRAWGVAGAKERIKPFVQDGDALAQVVQTRDSLCSRQADFILAQGRDLQFTYGCLSSGITGKSERDPEDLLLGALERNLTGSVLVSTRRADRIGLFARMMS